MRTASVIAAVMASMLLCDIAAYEREDIIRDYDASCSFMESGLFTTTDIQWHKVEHPHYVVSIDRGTNDNDIIIRNFLPGEQALNAVFDPVRNQISIPVQEWPFAGYEFCHGSTALQYSDDRQVVVGISADPTGVSDFIIEFPSGSWAVRDAAYGDYISVRFAETRLVARVKTQSGITDATAETDDGILLNLQGQEVKNPAPGIYIRISSGTSHKVVIR